jgi:glycosyltransferase involved in cell wall biosynthesis
MRLLVLTQAVDKRDPTLGFFHNWLFEFSSLYEKVITVCLKRGDYFLPGNVEVFSLGKESGVSKIKYLINFYYFIFKYRKEYDAVFVHMNEEYVILGGFFWKCLGKKVFFWRNHKKGSFLTRLAVLLSEKVFCTSKKSFTAKFKKTVLMPVGINTDLFCISDSIDKRGSTFLSLGRIDPVKRVDILAEVFSNIDDVNFNLTVVGNASLKYGSYYKSIVEKLKKLIPTGRVSFLDSVDNDSTPALYNKNKFFINLTPSGSFDKTIIEAMACGCFVLTPNEDLFDHIDINQQLKDLGVYELIRKVKEVINLPVDTILRTSNDNRKYVLENHSQKKLFSDLKKIIC